MASYELGSLVWKITGDTTNFDKSITSSQSRMRRFSETASKIGGNLTKFVTAPLLGVGAASVKAASDLEESLNAVNVVFGDAADTIEQFGQTSAENVGLSQNAFNSLATVIGAQLKQSGLEIDAVADQTTELTTRAADLASVFNTEVSDATNALGAALRGENEPARRFGINISQAAIEAEALASGLVESKDQIDEQIKVQARYNLIMEQSADVAGDFQNTSDSLANQTRILRADLVDIGAELGEAFIPAVTDAVGAVRGAVEWFGDLDEGTRQVITRLSILAASSGPILLGVSAIQKMTLAIRALNTAALFGPAGIIVGIGLLAAGLVVLTSNTESATEASRRHARELQKESKQSQELLTEMEGLSRGSERRQEIIDELNEKYPELNENIDTETASTEELRDEVEKLNEERRQDLESQVLERLSRLQEGLGQATQDVENYRIGLENLEEAGKENSDTYREQQELLEQAQAAQRNLSDRVREQEGVLQELAWQRREGTDAVEEETIALEDLQERIDEGTVSQEQLQGMLEEGRITTETFNAAMEQLAESTRDSGNAAASSADHWSTWLARILDVEEGLTGAEGASRFIGDLNRDAEAAAETARQLGVEFDRIASLEDRMQSIRQAIIDLTSLDPADTSETFSFDEDEQAIQRLLEEYRRLQAIAEETAETEEQSTQRQTETRQEYYDRVREAEQEIADRREEQRREEEAAEQEHIDNLKEQWRGYFDTIESFVTTGLDLRMQSLDAEAEAVERSTNRELAALEERYQRELELAGVAEETAVERAQRKLEEAKKANDQEAIDEARTELRKAEIDQQYSERRQEIKQEEALRLWEIEKEQHEVQKRLDQIQAAITTAQMAMNAYNALVGIPVVGPGLAVAAAAAATAFGVKQQQLIASQPAPPKPEFAQGGEFITDGRQEIVVGDNPGGQERVSVEPLSSPNVNGPSGQSMVIELNLDGKRIATNTVDYVNNGRVRLETAR